MNNRSVNPDPALYWRQVEAVLEAWEIPLTVSSMDLPTHDLASYLNLLHLVGLLTREQEEVVVSREGCQRHVLELLEGQNSKDWAERAKVTALLEGEIDATSSDAFDAALLKIAFNVTNALLPMSMGQPRFRIKVFVDSRDPYRQVMDWLESQDVEEMVGGHKIGFLAGALYYEWLRCEDQVSANRVRALLDWFDAFQEPRSGFILPLKKRLSLQEALGATHAFVTLALASGRGIKHMSRLIDSCLVLLDSWHRDVMDGKPVTWKTPLLAASLLLLLRDYLEHRPLETTDALHSLESACRTALIEQCLSHIGLTAACDMVHLLYGLRLSREPIRQQAAPKEMLTLPGHIGFRAFGLPIEYHFERVLPNSPQAPKYVIDNQLRRYRFAAQHIAGSDKVLDVGCGSGWGTSKLAEVASQVVGTDIDEETLRTASAEYATEALTFVQSADLLETFGEEWFDVITLFEVVEHVDKKTVERMLASIATLLAPAGKLIGTTPVVRGREGNRMPRNPHHVYEYSAPELVSLLSTHFGHVELHAIGNRGSLTFIAAKNRSIDVSDQPKQSEGNTLGANAFLADSRLFMDEDPVWAFETGMRAWLLRPYQPSAIWVLLQAMARLLSRPLQRRRFRSAMLWRLDYQRGLVPVAAGPNPKEPRIH